MKANTNSRGEIKAFFKKGATPTEAQFAAMIDGMINESDDGLVKLPGSPVAIQAEGQTSSKRVLDLYRSLADVDPEWALSLSPLADPSNLQSGKVGLGISDKTKATRLFIDGATGNVGVGTVQPTATLHVAGNLKVTGTLTAPCEKWTPLALQSKYTPYTGGYSVPSYCRDGMGFVHLRGIVGVPGASGLIATLPSGYTPEGKSSYLAMTNASGGNPGTCRIDIGTDGTITHASAYTWISFEGLTFMAYPYP